MLRLSTRATISHFFSGPASRMDLAAITCAVWARTVEEAVERLVVVPGDHDGALGCEEVEQ